MDNNARIARVQALVSDISATQIDAQSHQANFQSISQQASGALSDYLKSQGIATVDELVNQVLQALPADEKAKVLARMHELTPKQGLDFFLQPSEIAKFLLWGYLISGAQKVAMPYFYQAKAYYIASRSQMLMDATRTGKAVSQEGKQLAALSQEERQALLDGLQEERNALGVEILDGDMMKEVGISFKDIAGVEMSQGDAITINSKIDEAAAAIENLEATEAKAIASAAKITVWTKVFIGINIAAIVEEEEAKELKETIAKMATARLTAKIAERKELVQTDQMSAINMLVAAIKDDNVVVQNFVKQQFADTVTKALTSIGDQDTYDMLVAQDKAVSADTREDPSLPDMEARIKADAASQMPSRPVTNATA